MFFVIYFLYSMYSMYSMSTAFMPIRLSLSLDTVASYPSSLNLLIPLLNPYCGVERSPSMLLNVAITLSIYDSASVPMVPSRQ